jgi:HEPN domain-containing protein
MADLGAAAILLKHGGDRAVAAMHVQQAVEKALKGYLISKGWKLKRTHDLIQLLDQAVRFEAGFEKFRAFCDFSTS